MKQLHLFDTPLFIFHPDNADALNAALRPAILQERQESGGVRRSNVGGWHSIPDLAQRRGAPFRPLMETLVEHVSGCTQHMADLYDVEVPPHRWGVHGWSMVMERGHYVIPHDHAQATWSLAWYVDAGDPPSREHPESGKFAALDPRRAGGAVAGFELFPDTFTLTPETGMLVVFPGYLQHYVHTYHGERPRICISCNLVMDLIGPGAPS